MNDEEQFIAELKKFRAAPMPGDLRERLSESPQISKGKAHRLWLPVVGTAIAACLALIWALSSDSASPQSEEVALNILGIDSTLVSRETVEFKEIDGVMHEIVMETWRDELFARSSLDPATADSVVLRRERVSKPVKFL
ncbi:hypothetical protein N9A94_03040 [Akkermansiaceae bacterium]|nr:hypothetical protein [Akkermansiaceae bacterium]